MSQALALLVAGVRLGTLVQMAPALPEGLHDSRTPLLYAASWAAATAMAVAAGAVALIRKRPLPVWFAGLDLAVAAALLCLGWVTVQPGSRIGTWVGFQPANALSVLVATAPLNSWTVWLGGLVSAVSGYIVYVSGAERGQVPTVIGNLLTFVVFAVVARGVAIFLQRLATDADHARAAAKEQGRAAEHLRARLALHNGTAMMRVLTEPALDSALRERLFVQAQHELRRMQSYLRGEVPADDGPATSLPHVLAGLCRDFDDLPIEICIDLADDIVLTPTTMQAVRQACISILLNAREHAHADRVVVHLDIEDKPPGRWTLTIRDDGRGFDPSSAQIGLGLREVTMGQLASHGIEVDLHTEPGSGTEVQLSAPLHTSQVST